MPDAPEAPEPAAEKPPTTHLSLDLLNRRLATRRRRRRIALIVTPAVALLAALVVAVVVAVRPWAPPTLEVQPGNRTPSGEELLTTPVATDPVITGVWHDPWFFAERGTTYVFDGDWIITGDGDFPSSISAVSLITGETRWTADPLTAGIPTENELSFVDLTMTSLAGPVILASTRESVPGRPFERRERVHAIDGVTGEWIWSSPPETELLASLGGGDILVVSRERGAAGATLQRLALRRGGEVDWSADIVGTPHVRGERVFLVDRLIDIHEVLDVADGSHVDSWSMSCFAHSFDRHLPETPVRIGELYIADDNDTDDRRIHVCTNDGREIRSIPVASWTPVADDWGDRAADPAPTSQLITTLRDRDGATSLHLLDLADGAELELAGSVPPRSEVKAYRVGDRIVVATGSWGDDPTISVYDALTGARLWGITGSTLMTLSEHGMTVTRYDTIPVDAAPDSTSDSEAVAVHVGLALEDGSELWTAPGEDSEITYLGRHAFLWSDAGRTALTASE